MTALSASYRNEFAKLLSRKKYIVFLFIGLAICLIWAGLGQLLASFIKQSGGLSLVLSPTPMGMLPFFLQILVPLLMFMGISDLLTVEGADSTMRAMICRPVERWKLYAAKILAVVTYAALYLTSIFIICAILNLIFGKALSVTDLVLALISYALTLIPLAVLASFAALVALLGRSSTLTMFILLLSYLLLNVLPVFFPVLSEMLFTSYLSWYRLWIGALPGASKLIHMLAIVLGYGTVFFMAGSLIFDRKDY
ncbi:MAG: ABC transporter permease subunit [Clostridiales bacterium]|jgi:ABC-2 type transport system permease protein|nr:ABC transporter permease subunit [Clostridiales bacterium]